MSYVAGQPILYIDSAKTSTLEGSATTVYAQGGKGNARLIAWDGEKTLTFTVEDALLSEVGFSLLSGAGLLKAGSDKTVYVHTTATAVVDANGKIDLTDTLGTGNKIDNNSPVFVMVMENGSITSKLTGISVDATTKQSLTGATSAVGKTVLVDFYIAKASGVTELQIDAENFAGYYYVEASTLYRRQSDGQDLPAELVFPNVKIQSNFTFNMAASGDPSTFSFVMDAMPGYTRFDRSKKVLCAMQIVDETAATETAGTDSIGTEASSTKQYPVVGE